MSSNNSTLLTTPENANGNVANLTVNIQDITLDEPHHIGDANGEEDKRREDEENEVDEDEEEADKYDKGDEIGAFKVPIVRSYSFKRPESPRRPSSRGSGSFDDITKKQAESPSNMDLFVDDIPNYNDPNEAVKFQRVHISGETFYNEETSQACDVLLNCIEKRKKYRSYCVEYKDNENWGGLNKAEYIKLFKRNKEKRKSKIEKMADVMNDSLLKELLRRRPDIPYNPYDDKRPLPLPTLHNIICKDGVYYATFETKIKGNFSKNGSPRPMKMKTEQNDKTTMGGVSKSISFASPMKSSSENEMKAKTILDTINLNKNANDDDNKNNDMDDDFIIPSYEEFEEDFKTIVHASTDPKTKTFAYNRNIFLKSKFNTHVMLNRDRELAAQKAVPHRDFYNVRKVDTHIHHSACMNSKHLLRYIKSKLRTCADEVVINREGQFLSLRDVFHSLELTAYDLSVDTLDTHAHHETFHRFDRFNLKYNPCGQSRLREIFLKSNNLIQGRYLAELTSEVFDDLEQNKYQMMEPRISIYGRNKKEWNILGNWIVKNRLLRKEVRWMIQLPRLYQIYKKIGLVNSFQDLLDNFFEPLFQVSKDPSIDKNLHIFLQHMVGFDCVDDESRPEIRDLNLPKPEDWTRPENPPYRYWLYYFWANIQSLNHFRHKRGLNTFSVRPHSGEAGSKSHLACTFLLADHINHGIRLKDSPVLLYLYYLMQIGLAMSPLSNNRLFLTYAKNPFIDFFKIGMNVSLSTDDPLQLHFTKDALLEEYSVARQVYALSNCDVCELARNSVLQSGFEHPFKRHFIGKNYSKESTLGNDMTMTNVPDVRIVYRYETLQEEWKLIKKKS